MGLHRQIQIGRPLRLEILSTWEFLLQATPQTSLRRLRLVPPEFDALFAAARTWDTLTSVSLPLPRCQWLGIFAEEWMSGYSSERRSSFH